MLALNKTIEALMYRLVHMWTGKLLFGLTSAAYLSGWVRMG